MGDWFEHLFSLTFWHDIFQNYVKGGFEKVYLRDDEPCNVIGKGDVMVSLSNGSTLEIEEH